MNTQMLSTSKNTFRKTLLAIAATLSFSAIGSTGATSSANAQPSGWEVNCTQKVDSPANGDTLREFLCTRQRDCQADANRKGAPAFGNGCFGVAPSANYSR